MYEFKYSFCNSHNRMSEHLFIFQVIIFFLHHRNLTKILCVCMCVWQGGGGGGGGGVFVVVCWLLNIPANMQVYLRDGSAQTILCAATLRQKLQIQLSASPSHSILTLG